MKKKKSVSEKQKIREEFNQDYAKHALTYSCFIKVFLEKYQSSMTHEESEFLKGFALLQFQFSMGISAFLNVEPIIRIAECKKDGPMVNYKIEYSDKLHPEPSF